jgi:hypothetical protein
MQAMLGWSMFASWIAIIWMMWKIVQDAKAVVRTHRPRNRADH